MKMHRMPQVAGLFVQMSHSLMSSAAELTCKDKAFFASSPPCSFVYGVATMSRLLKIIGLFCKRALQKREYSAKETYNFKEPTNRSHPILSICVYLCVNSCKDTRYAMARVICAMTLVYVMTCVCAMTLVYAMTRVVP